MCVSVCYGYDSIYRGFVSTQRFSFWRCLLSSPHSHSLAAFHNILFFCSFHRSLLVSVYQCSSCFSNIIFCSMSYLCPHPLPSPSVSDVILFFLSLSLFHPLSASFLLLTSLHHSLCFQLAFHLLLLQAIDLVSCEVSQMMSAKEDFDRTAGYRLRVMQPPLVENMVSL